MLMRRRRSEMRLFSSLILAASLLATGPLGAQELTGTLARIAETGRFTIGYRTSEPPLSFADDTGLPAGYSVALCDAVFEETRAALGRDDIQAAYVAVTSEDRFEQIVAGEIDILCGVTTKTLSRAERVGFSQVTFATGGGLLSMDTETRVERFSDLAGKRIAVAPATSTLDALNALLEARSLNAEIVEIASADESIAALQNGEVDVYAADQITLLGKVMTQTDASLSYFIAGDPISYEPFALAFARGDADFALVVERALSGLNSSGEIAEVYQKWFGPFGLTANATQRAIWQLGSVPE